MIVSDSLTAFARRRLAALARDGLLRTPPDAEPRPHGRIRLGGRELVNFGANDYLGLAGDPRLAEAAADAARRYGTGATASPSVCGRTPPLVALEHTLAAFEGTDDAVVFASGYAANLAAVRLLAGRGDTLFCERESHACLVDGCRLSDARLRVFRRSDLDRLGSELSKPTGGRRVVVTDAVFSMDGDLAPLPELLALADRFDAWVLADEAHGTGVFGEHGRGAAEELGVPGHPRLLRTGTLSKAVGAAGGFVCGPRPMCDLLRNVGRSLVYSTAPPPPTCGAAERAVRLIRDEPDRRRTVRAAARRLRERMRAAGRNPLGDDECPIVPIPAGGPADAVRLSAMLREDGFFVPAIRPPTVPRGTSRLRASLSAAHAAEDLARLAEVLGRSGCA